MKRILLAATLSLLGSALMSSGAFAQTYQPYQPYQQVGANTYNQDFAECQAYANQVSPVWIC